MTVNKLASEWFIQRYKESPGAKEYVLKKRGIKAETAELFCIGYAPEKGGLKQYLTGLGWEGGRAACGRTGQEERGHRAGL